ncbi:MAG: DUF342 domain-containing protein [Candidatus Omnitrophota bacterium]|jgi:uncharacterized protein (DUF342 family)|nr:MAG: DUF342 domain-containing protein [Candidatus Omnitrophota bacterium]
MADNPISNETLVDSPPERTDTAVDPPVDVKHPDMNWDDGLSLEVSAGEMKATLQVDVTHSENYQPDDLVRFLNQHNVVYGIDPEAIQSIFDKKLFNQGVVVARGVQPVHGKNGRVEWDIDLSILDGAKLVEKGGRVDWKDQHHVLSVKENQRMARMIDPTGGEPGKNIYGQEIPSTPGKETKFPAGKGTRIGDDGKELFSQLAGVVCMEGEKISVTQTYSVPGDVSFKTGNINYDETVVISGGVLSDFKVHAGQDIHINGLVEAAELTADGNIYIHAGIQGNEKAFIHAGGNITTKFINNATIEAEGDIFVEGSITHSRVKALGRIIVSGNRAVILGGHVSAEQEISADSIGTEIGVKTMVVIGEAVQSMNERKREAEEKIVTFVENYRKTKEALRAIERIKEKGTLSKNQEELHLKLVRCGLQLQGEIKKKKEEILVLSGQIEKNRNSQKGVVVKNTVWPGTMIQIMHAKYLVRAPHTKVHFALLGSEIELLSIKESAAEAIS